MGKYKNPIAPAKTKRPTYNMTDEQLALYKQDARREGMRAGTYAANAMYSVALLLVLRDQLGFGQTRLARIFRAVQKLFDEIADDEVAYLDAARVLHDECGINLTIQKAGETPVDAMEMFRKMEIAKQGYRVRLK